MTPAHIAKCDTEHGHQKAFFAYCDIACQYGFDTADEWCRIGEYAINRVRDKSLGAEFPINPFLQWIHAIPNGGARGDNKRSNQIRGAQLKAEGVKKGVADIFLPHPFGDYAGLYIEMKKPSLKPKRKTSKGGVSYEQREFLNYADSVGYECAVCYGWQEAVQAIKNYLLIT